MKEKFLILWDKFWFSRFDPVSVGMFRVSLGVLMIVMFMSNYFNWERFYASDGILSLNEAGLEKPYESIYSVFYWTEGKVNVQIYWWIGFLSSIAFTIGLKTRLVTIVLYVLIVSMVHRNGYIVNGDDLVIRMLLFYGCFSPLGYSLSLDSFLKKRFSNTIEIEQLPMIWSIRSMQINILLIYIISAPNKLADDIAWLNGEAIYYTVVSNMWSRCPYPDLFYMWDGLLSKISTYGTIFIEGSFPILVWFKKTKLIAIALISSLHIGIAFLVPNVLFFTLAMVCSFWVFVPPEITRRIIEYLFNFKNKFPLRFKSLTK